MKLYIHNTTLQLHIRLKEIDSPEVWRRVLVPSTFTFYKLHRAIQTSFGWKNYHLFQFIEFERSFTMPLNIGMPDPEFDEHVSNAKKIRLNQIFPFEEKLKYIYDFGDVWEHVITLEQTFDEESKHASLVAGEGACPPEDCRGPHGYEDLKTIMADPEHEEYEDFRLWLGLRKNQNWDPYAFDKDKVAAKVARL
jgi:hypothetical protein